MLEVLAVSLNKTALVGFVVYLCRTPVANWSPSWLNTNWPPTA